MSYLKKCGNVSRHLKLEFASAIPASNDEKPQQIIQQDTIPSRVIGGLRGLIGC